MLHPTSTESIGPEPRIAGSRVRPLGFLLVLPLLTCTPAGAAQDHGSQLGEIAIQLVRDVGAAKKQRIAVTDFADVQGRTTELGRFVAEELSVRLARAAAERGIAVIDRAHLRTLLEEHKLASTGLIDPRTARRLGEIAGVDVLVTGTLTGFGDSVRLTVKALDLSTAAIIGAASSDLARTKAIEELLGRDLQSTRTAGSAAGTAAAPSGREQTADGFVFRLQHCVYGLVVRCTFAVSQSSGASRPLKVFEVSRAADDSAQELTARSVGMAGSGLEPGSYDRNKVEAGASVKSDVPITVYLDFPFPRDRRRLTFVEMRGATARPFAIRFENIDVTPRW